MIRRPTSMDPQILSVEQLFTDAYSVPLYQRAYAWTAVEIQTLMADVRDARLKSVGPESGREGRDYYIGSLVVNPMRTDDRVVYEVVDGQQRLTTLFIILAVATRIHSAAGEPRATLVRGSLSFEGRDAAGQDLRRLARDGADAVGRLTTDGISHAVELVEQAAHRGSAGAKAGPTQDIAFSSEDLEYLLHHVKILRTELPPETDLNHYFEVMNTRGEQLEKHEILKAQLISQLESDAEANAFSQVWDACAVLDRHVQTQFSPSEDDRGTSPRTRIFGVDWDIFEPTNTDELFQALDSDASAVDLQKRSTPAQTPGNPESRFTPLSEILRTSEPDRSTTREDPGDESGSYGSIIDFPNLLLHVLKLHRGEIFAWGETSSNTDRIRLEDKFLLEEFRRTMDRDGSSGRGGTANWVREFAFWLLKTRYLMDTYVIRTVTTTAGDDEENWVLHRAFRYERDRKRQLSARSTFGADDSSPDHAFSNTDPLQRRVVVLQALFQVTDTRRASKYFLFQILEWLHQQRDAGAIEGRRLVEHVEAMARRRLRSLQFRQVVNNGTYVPNFVFNMLDYELWRLAFVEKIETATDLLGPEAARALQSAGPGFRFRYRTSVEHFYPVSPSAAHGHQALPEHVRDQFGNLCIMSRSENSRRNNLMPIPKAKEFLSTDQSLKFQLMAWLALRDVDWGEKQIEEHGAAMLRVLDNVTGDDVPRPGITEPGLVRVVDLEPRPVRHADPDIFDHAVFEGQAWPDVHNVRALLRRVATTLWERDPDLLASTKDGASMVTSMKTKNHRYVDLPGGKFLYVGWATQYLLGAVQEFITAFGLEDQVKVRLRDPADDV